MERLCRRGDVSLGGRGLRRIDSTDRTHRKGQCSTKGESLGVRMDGPGGVYEPGLESVEDEKDDWREEDAEDENSESDSEPLKFGEVARMDAGGLCAADRCDE